MISGMTLSPRHISSEETIGAKRIRRVPHVTGSFCVSGEPVPRSLEGLFVYEERNTSPPANDTIVVEQWTVIEVSVGLNDCSVVWYLSVTVSLLCFYLDERFVSHTSNIVFMSRAPM